MNRPQLMLNRLVITGHGRTVYDETFHSGVNIIRGANGSGKSTVTDMIFFVLGGENVEWTDQAKSCDHVFAEIAVSGTTISLRREIDSAAPSIGVAEGSLNDNLDSAAVWSMYGRQRSERKESFSQLMFQRLGLPATKSDDSTANVTMYQVLRLLYGDQNTDSTSLFRRERQPFGDRQDVRRSVGEMLLGIDDLRGHELRQQLIQLTKLHSQKKSRLDSLVEAAVKTDSNFSLAQYSDLIANAKTEQQKLEKEISDAGEASASAATTSASQQKKIQNLRKQLSVKNSLVASLEQQIQSLELNLADSEVFIESLKSDLASLTAANESRDLIGKVSLLYCPICLATLDDDGGDHCPLCKATSSGDAITDGRLRYSQELKHQISESKALNAQRAEKLSELKQLLRIESRVRAHTLEDLRSLVSPTTHLDAHVSALLKRHGYLTRLTEDLTRLEGLQKEVELLQKNVAETQRRLDSVEAEIKLRHQKQETRRALCQKKIGDLTIETLHEDIVDNNKDTLRDASGLVFSFEKDFLSVRQGRLSASTQVFLKNSFFLGLLKFSITDSETRLPKFFLLDNIEDKGMVPERFRKFHHLLIEYSESVSIPHQVILTTSYIDDELNDSKYCVGRSYDKPPYTLDLKGEWGHFRNEDVDERSSENPNSSSKEAAIGPEEDFHDLLE